MATAAADPFYSRKPVPKELIEDVGITDLTPLDEHLNRERKYSTSGGGDVRRFSNPRTKHGKDPFYARRRVSDAEIAGVGATGLTSQEEHLNRERKYSLADGSDVRVFSNKATPQSDPFYGRRKVSNNEITGIGETGNTQAQDYEIRERKQSLFQLSDDPFSQVAGTGHRQSISATSTGAAAAATERRRSSVAALQQQQKHGATAHLGEKLKPIESRPEGPETETSGLSPVQPTTSAAKSESTAAGTSSSNAYVYDYDDPDSVDPYEIR